MAKVGDGVYCPVCGKLFAKEYAASKYCSQKCKRQMECARKRGEVERDAEDDKHRESTQPCWSCRKACGGCRWSDSLKPVKGWKAKRVTRIFCRGKQVCRTMGYAISYCPEYVKDKPRKVKKR